MGVWVWARAIITARVARTRIDRQKGRKIGEDNDGDGGGN